MGVIKKQKKEKAKQITIAIYNNQLIPYQAWILYRLVYILSITYTLPQLITSMKEFQFDQKALIELIITKCRSNCAMS